MTPDVSVVIPTHNRLPYLRQCLNALAAQRFPLDRMEVIVVADGCTDGTEASLAEALFPFQLRVFAQPASGAAAARNRGAEEARSELLIFIDDDVIASPDLIAAHAGAHSSEEVRVAVGPYLPDQPDGEGYFSEHLYGWWKKTFDAMSDPEHLWSYHDVLAGNLSVATSTFRMVGGFNVDFSSCGVEDHELGVRLLSRGVRVVFVAEAKARHLETTDLARSFRRAQREGYAQAQFCELHPEVLPTLPLAGKIVPSRWLTLHAPTLAEHAMRVAEGLLEGVERLRLRWLWVHLFGSVRLYWYWRGVADYVGGGEGWGAWQEQLSGTSEPLPTGVVQQDN